MAKSKKIVVKNARRRITTPAPRLRGPLLDKPAADLARLLADPCGAPVVHTISPGTNGAFILRLEADNIIFSGPTETAGIFYWVPGAFRAFGGSSTGDNVATTLIAQQGFVPGNAFLANYSTARCVAACAQVMFPGTELQRSGVVSMGVIPAGVLTDVIPIALGGTAGNIQAAQVRAASQIVSRTPDITQEVRWRPGQGDSEDVDLVGLSQNPAQFPTVARGKNAIVITAAGLPVAVGIRIRCVAVYEVTPKGSQGLVASVETTRSTNNMTQVLQVLDRVKEDWWHGPVGVGVRGMASMAANSLFGPMGGSMVQNMFAPPTRLLLKN